MVDIYLATGNEHKVFEISDLLERHGLDQVSVHSAKAVGGMPEVDESADTFAGNAQLKAQALRDRIPAAALALADDSGLEVDALDGAPGVYSARFAGPNATDADNRAKLKAELTRLGLTESSARFRCVLCVIDAQGQASYFPGACEGRVICAERGVNGFGYDAMFIPDGYAETFGELGDAVKARLSHRADAVTKLAGWLGKGRCEVNPGAEN